jgi:hypothetical protein
MDVFTRRARGWELGRGLDQGLTLAALRRAMRRGRRPGATTPTRGYSTPALRIPTCRPAAAISMAAVGKPEEDGFAERLMRTIREEESDLSEYRDFADAYGQLGRFPDDVYDRKRIHSSLGVLTPAEFEQQWLRGPNATALPGTVSDTDSLWCPSIQRCAICPGRCRRRNDRGRFNISLPSDALVDPANARCAK